MTPTTQAREVVNKLCDLHRRMLTEKRRAFKKHTPRLDLVNGEADTVLDGAVTIERLLDRSAQILAMMRENTDPTCNEEIRALADRIEAEIGG